MKSTTKKTATADVKSFGTIINHTEVTNYGLNRKDLYHAVMDILITVFFVTATVVNYSDQNWLWMAFDIVILLFIIYRYH